MPITPLYVECSSTYTTTRCEYSSSCVNSGSGWTGNRYTVDVDSRNGEECSARRNKVYCACNA